MLILASASPSRRQMLTNVGLDFAIEPSGVDEDEVKLSLLGERATAQDIATTLAEMKALRVSTRRPGAFVIGADSTLACEGKFYDKPATLAAAREQLKALGGRTHELVSSVVVARNGARLWHTTETGRLTMRPFTDAFLDAYLARAGDAVCASVGAYQLEGLGAHLFTPHRRRLFHRARPAVAALVGLPGGARDRPGESGMSPYETLLREAHGRPFAAIVGWPVEHSRSPALHGFWLKQHGIDGHYGRLPVEPKRAALEELIAFLKRTPNARGCNLTLPHKIDIMPLLDRIDPLAKHIGAVNTVIKQPDGTLEGRNSDGFGFLEALKQGAPGWQAAAGPVVVLGAGGAARAVVATLVGGRRARAASDQPHAEERDRSRRRLHAQRRPAHRHRALGRARRRRSTAPPCW